MGSKWDREIVYVANNDRLSLTERETEGGWKWGFENTVVTRGRFGLGVVRVLGSRPEGLFFVF